MNEESLWTRMPRLKPIMAVSATAVMFYAWPCFGQSATTPQSLLREPPKLNYAKICVKALPVQPLATDWTQWNGQDNGVPVEHMLADAKRLSDGDGEVRRDRALARKLLSHIASGTSPAATIWSAPPSAPTRCPPLT